MGVKELWSVLTPYCERKPICELRGKCVAIDLAGWVCESLNVVDYFVHPRHHLKNLFFRTCYLIWEEVTPVFVLEGTAPKLKSQVIAKRNEQLFRGVKPKNKNDMPSQSQQSGSGNDKGRTRFNHVLKQCETLLQSLGIQCVQGPGEAEAYCAFLNKNGLVDGVISQDSDCFAYGAIRVYRNFSVSTQGAQAAQGGAVDIYDMRVISQKMDFGQHKIIAMALLCGCDYCPDGVGGVGRDGVLKLFNKYTEKEILQRLRNWRSEDHKYNALEMRVDDKSICSNCGHLGKTQSHTKSGCGVCRTNRSCDERLWKEERLSIKSELALRKKALTETNFPNEEIINEFLNDPATLPKMQLGWKQPNLVKFVKQIGHLLQWPEMYCFQKFFPILTRWQVRNFQKSNTNSTVVEPKEIIKKRTVKGVPSLEILWKDTQNLFQGLIPQDQLRELEQDNPKGLNDLWSTVEPLSAVEQAFPEMVENFLKSKEKPKKEKKVSKAKSKTNNMPLGSLENLCDLIAATEEIGKSLKKSKQKVTKAPKQKGVQLIDKFFKQKIEEKLMQQDKQTPIKLQMLPTQCSTPVTKCLLDDMDSEDDSACFDLSDIIKGMVQRNIKPVLNQHAGRVLIYEPMSVNMSIRLKNTPCLDDADLLAQKRNASFNNSTSRPSKRFSLDDSFDLLVNKENHRLHTIMEKAKSLSTSGSPYNLEKSHTLSSSLDEKQAIMENSNVSYFFNHSVANDDAFEQAMELSFVTTKSVGSPAAKELITISDSDSQSD